MVRRSRTDAPASDPRSTVAVDLSAEVVDRVEARLAHCEFDSVDRYVEFVLEEVLARVEDARGDADDPVDREEIASRLEALGYLD